MDEPWHGTPGGYSNHGCDCNPCQQAYRADRAKMRRSTGMQATKPSPESRDKQWQRVLDAARDYRKRHGDLHPVPLDYVAPNGVKLNACIRKLRIRYAKGILPRERVAALDALGMVWSPRYNTKR